MKYDARCNKRACQARKPLNGPYYPNARVPCHIPGCTGLMYKDSNRATKERKALDTGGGRPLCHCDGMQWADMRGSPHKRGDKGCKHHEDARIEQSLLPVPKHSPRQRPYEPGGELPF